MGMKDRINILGDDEASAPENWDPIWKNPVDILITINAQNKNALKERYQVICDHKDRTKGGVEQLLGHQGRIKSIKRPPPFLMKTVIPPLKNTSVIPMELATPILKDVSKPASVS